MKKEQLYHLLTEVSQKKMSVDDAVSKLKRLPFEDLGFARVDCHRELRIGYPEVIFCQGKKHSQVIDIASRLAGSGSAVVATRASEELYNELSLEIKGAEYFSDARIIAVNGDTVSGDRGPVLVISAGTSDMPIAEEAAVTAELSGCRVERMYDCGVAGIHRLFSGMDKIEGADVIIAVAGMDGALPSIIGGIAGKPVVAVPTSIGYGAAFGGLAPLLTMLNSCAPGVSVVNIDNGFGAGYLAALICRRGDNK